MSSPDQRAFEADINKPAFRLGEAECRWKLIKTDWPFAFITVTAKDDTKHPLRFDCTGYPEMPTARPWDIEANAPLTFDKWPSGKGGRVSAVFNHGWKGGTALYLPCDRVAIVGHGKWKTDLPSMIWKPNKGIVHYLEIVHELLQSKDYSSPAVTPA